MLEDQEETQTLGRVADEVSPPTPETRGNRPDLGFFGGTEAGRAILSLGLAFLVGILVIWNLPSGSHIRDEIRNGAGVRYPMRSLGLDQNWGVFSPNPTTISIRVEADVYFRSGEVLHHVFPEGNWHVGGLSEYRWRKWERRVRLDDRRSLWRPAAEWLAGQYEDVSQIVLIRYWSDTPTPGGDEERTWQSFEFFTLEVTG